MKKVEKVEKVEKSHKKVEKNCQGKKVIYTDVQITGYQGMRKKVEDPYFSLFSEIITARLNALTANEEGGDEATEATRQRGDEATEEPTRNEEPTPRRQESLRRQSKRRQSSRRRSSTDALFLDDLPPPQLTGMPLIQIYSVNIS